MSEEKEHIGDLGTYEVKTGGKGGTYYRIQIGKIFFSSFDDPAPFRNKHVKFRYTETPNPTNVKFPYKNIVPKSMEVATPEEAVANKTDQGTSQVAQQPQANGQKLGMLFKETMLHLRYKLEHPKSGETLPEFDILFDSIFQTLFKKMEEVEKKYGG